MISKLDEQTIQNTVAQALDAADVVWFHPVNEQSLLSLADDPQAMLQSLGEQGLKSGLPDVIILESPPTNKRACGTALELKAGGNTPTDHQDQWLHKLNECGFDTEWTQGLDPALQQLATWGYINQ